MRFELRLLSNTVAIRDKYNDSRPVFVANNDTAIRDGIKTFYNMDAFRYDFTEEEQKDYVEKMMDALPKEDLSFKEVKDIE